MPRNAANLWRFGIGAILLFFLCFQIVTGLFLAMFYIPQEELAFQSVIHIIRNVNHGELIRNGHSIGASFFFFACYIHIFRGMYYGVYRKPHQKLWVLSVLLYFLMMVTAFLGYSLIWSQRSYWAAMVITRLVALVPGIGETLHSYLIGGYQLGTPTLGRFFVLHFMIPFIIVLFSVIHIRMIRIAHRKYVKTPETRLSPKGILLGYRITLKDAATTSLLLTIFVYFLFFVPHSLSHADNFVMADPTVSPTHVAPEWYFMPFFAMLRCIENEALGALAMFGAVGIFAFMPWLDTSRTRFRDYSMIFKVLFWIWIANAVFLGWLGSQPLEGDGLRTWLFSSPASGETNRVFSQLATLYYFAFFFILLPVRRFIEKQPPHVKTQEKTGKLL